VAETTIRRDDFRRWVKIPVRWGDMDAVGHVNNATYFTYCESARTAYFEDIGVGRFAEMTEGPALARAELNFRRQVRHPAVLEVGVRVPEVRTRSFRMDYGIFFEATDTLVADGTSVVAWANYAAGRSVEIPPAVRAAIEAIEK
jgi:acyl-CoA thioester hydrolase